MALARFLLEFFYLKLRSGRNKKITVHTRVRRNPCAIHNCRTQFSQRGLQSFKPSRGRPCHIDKTGSNVALQDHHSVGSWWFQHLLKIQAQNPPCNCNVANDSKCAGSKPPAPHWHWMQLSRGHAYMSSSRKSFSWPKSAQLLHQKLRPARPQGSADFAALTLHEPPSRSDMYDFPVDSVLIFFRIGSLGLESTETSTALQGMLVQLHFEGYVQPQFLQRDAGNPIGSPAACQSKNQSKNRPSCRFHRVRSFEGSQQTGYSEYLLLVCATSSIF